MSNLRLDLSCKGGSLRTSMRDVWIVRWLSTETRHLYSGCLLGVAASSVCFQPLECSDNYIESSLAQADIRLVGIQLPRQDRLQKCSSFFHVCVAVTSVPHLSDTQRELRTWDKLREPVICLSTRAFGQMIPSPNDLFPSYRHKIRS